MKNGLILLFSIFLITTISCVDEPIDQENVNRNMVDEELFNFLRSTVNTEELGINCIKFNYLFTVFEFDPTREIVRAEVIFDDFDFIQFLDSVSVNNTISINYPISGTLDNGEEISITSNDELKLAISVCAKEEYKQRCDGALEGNTQNCIWKLKSSEEDSNQFEGSFYSFNSNGTMTYHIESKVYFGTWVTLYIGDILYLNIDLNDDENIETFWDANWIIELSTLSDINLKYAEANVALKKECTLDCSAIILKTCELDNTSEQGIFNLSTYTSCFRIPDNHDMISGINYQFFETEIDAIDNTNVLSATNYMNNTNPQTIFVKCKYIASQEVLEIFQITLEVALCPGG